MEDFRFFDENQNIDVSALNQLAEKAPDLLIRKSEEHYYSQLHRIATAVSESGGKIQLILLAGPSASGKTTTSHKLSEVLSGYGIKAPVVSLDDFFRGADLYPILPDGTTDFESIQCLDIDLIHKCFEELIRTGHSILPTYDFTSGARAEKVNEITLSKKDVLIVEGNHALNPILSQQLPAGSAIRVYVCPARRYVNHGETIFSPRGIRLMRRMVRDSKFRNYPPLNTLSRWKRVLEGETEYIYPFENDADFRVDSSIAYEPCVFHHYLLPIIDPENSGEYREQLEGYVCALEQAADIDWELIPESSLLREFIGEEEVR